VNPISVFRSPRNPFAAQFENSSCNHYSPDSGRIPYRRSAKHIVWLPGPCNRYIAKNKFRPWARSLTVTQYTSVLPGRLTEAAARVNPQRSRRPIRNVFVWCCKSCRNGDFQQDQSRDSRGRDDDPCHAHSCSRMLIRSSLCLHFWLNGNYISVGRLWPLTLALPVYGHHRPMEPSDLICPVHYPIQTTLTLPSRPRTGDT